MKRRALAAPNAAVAVVAFGMIGMIQTFTDETPLHGGVLIVIERGDFIYSPAHRAVIDYDILAANARDGIFLQLVYIAETNAKIANDNIIGGDDQWIIFETNAIAGRGLAGDGEIAVADAKLGLQRDRAGKMKDDRSRAFGFNGRAQTAGAAIIQSDDFENFSATAAAGETAKSFRSGES